MSASSPSGRFQRLRAWTALVAFLSTLGLPVATAGHQMWGDDPACRQAGVGPARNTIQITDVPPAGQADHCAICHWLRTARGARTVLSASTAVSLHSTDPLVLRRASRAPLDVVSYRPSRAPPTRLI